MRGFVGFLAFSLIALCGMAQADPVRVKPDGCDFAFIFPAVPTQAQTKTQTSRGDDVITNRADLKLEENGKISFLRIECTVIPHQGQVDEEILRENMKDLGTAYKLEGAIASVDHNGLTGAVGHIQGRATLGGKPVMLKIDRYTTASGILDIWTGADPDSFPSQADTTFLKAITFQGQNLP